MAVVHRTVASLRILADEFDPDEITAALGKQPDIAERRGDTIRTPSRRERIALRNRWHLRGDCQTPGDLDAQIADLLSGTTDDLEIWRSITSRYRVDVFCGLFLDETNEGLTISPATLKALGDRGIELDLDIYAGPDEESDD